MDSAIETNILKLRKKISVPMQGAFWSVIVTGFLTHGFIFYNKMSYLDDSTYYFELGATFASGRWGLGIIETVKNWLGFGSYSMPVINGFLTIIFIAIMAMFLVFMLHIKSRLFAVLIGAYMVIFPVVTSTFAYMFTAPWYFLSNAMMVLAVYLVRKSKGGFVAATLLIAFGMGIYQANIGVATAAFVMTLLCDAKSKNFLENISTAIRCFLSLLAGIALYFLFNKMFLYITDTQLSDYQGISGMSNLSLSHLLSGIADAYKLWPQLTRWSILGISNAGLIRMMYAVSLGLFLILGVVYLFMLGKKKEIWNMLYSAVLIGLVPLSIGVIFVMASSPDTNIHTLMVYSFVVMPIYPLVLLQNLETETFGNVGKNVLRQLGNVAVIVISVMIVFYFKLDNTAYLKANYQQENAIAYYTILIGQIKSTDHYSDKLPVLFLGNVDGQDWSIKSPKAFDEIKIQGYHANMNDFIAYYVNSEFLEIHCGYRFEKPDKPEKIYESGYVKMMPCYPEDGSIQVVDDVVVVKLSDNY